MSRTHRLAPFLLVVLAASAGCSSESPSPAPQGTGGGGGGGVASLAGGMGGSPSGGGPAGGAGAGGNTGLGGTVNAAGGAGVPGTAGAAGATSPAGGGPSAGGGGAPAGAGSSGAAGARSTSSYPFPQNTQSARCTYPTTVTAEAARAAYTKWKTEVVTADGAGGHLRVRRPNSPGSETNSTVSEGIAYGMMIAVAMDDQPLFDELWLYSQLWLNGNGLMHWYINAAGTSVLGSGGATDSDEDIAWALVMADRAWGGSGSLSDTYLNHAKRQIDRIWNHEVDHAHADLLLPGDAWAGKVIFNPSYFAPNEYRIFGQVSGKADDWKRVIDTGYTVLAKSLNAASGNQDNGLVPAWCDDQGVPMEPFAGGPTNYQYDSARTPFRIGLDYCFSGEPRAAAYLEKVSGFFAGVGAGSIVDGYNLNGTPFPDPSTPAGSPQSAVFVGSAAVGGMHDARYLSFVNDASQRVATGELLARSRYYNLSWTALTLLALSGNLLEYPAR